MEVIEFQPYSIDNTNLAEFSLSIASIMFTLVCSYNSDISFLHLRRTYFYITLHFLKHVITSLELSMVTLPLHQENSSSIKRLQNILTRVAVAPVKAPFMSKQFTINSTPSGIAPTIYCNIFTMFSM